MAGVIALQHFPSDVDVVVQAEGIEDAFVDISAYDTQASNPALG
jgi:hypothetical protein